MPWKPIKKWPTIKYGRSKDLSNFSVYKGKKFYDLIYHSLYEWQKFIVDKILNGESDDGELDVKRLSKEFSKDEGKYARFPRNMKKVDDFLMNYRHEGESRIGKYANIDGERLIIVDENFIKYGKTEGQQQDDNETDYL